MGRVIDQTQVAILYETITGQNQLRGKIVVVGPEIVDVDEFLADHSGLAAVVVSSGHLPHPSPKKSDHEHHPYHDAACRQHIAAHTGSSLLDEHDDRSVMVNAQGVIVSVHKGNVPGLDNPHPGHSLVSHRTAMVGHKLV